MGLFGLFGDSKAAKKKKAVKFITLACIAYTTVMWILLLVFPVPFIHIFNNDPELVEAAVPSLKLYFFGIFMMSLQFAGQNIFVSLGKAKQAVFFSIFRKVIIVVPLTYLLPYLWNLGVNGVFIAEPISNFIGGIACYTTMLFTAYRELNRKEKLKQA